MTLLILSSVLVRINRDVTLLHRNQGNNPDGSQTALISLLQPDLCERNLFENPFSFSGEQGLDIWSLKVPQTSQHLLYLSKLHYV